VGIPRYLLIPDQVGAYRAPLVAGNEALLRARLAQRSRARPLRPMSRRELAELVNQYIWDNYRQRTGLDENYIGKLERNVVRWPNDLYREALRAVLGAADEADLGFWPRGSGAWNAVDPVPALSAADRMSIVVASATLLDVMTPTPHPGRVGRPEVDQIWRAARAFSEWDNLVGGLPREAALAHLRWSAGLLRGPGGAGALRPELLSATAYLAHTCGFMAFDGYAFEDARRYLSFGITCAEEADDWHIRARLLATTARLDIWVGRPDAGLTGTQLALVRADRLTATEQAMVHGLAARALARMRRPQDALAAIGRADDAFARQDTAVDPPWMAFHDAAQHAGDTGAALWDLVPERPAIADECRARYVTASDDRPLHLARSLALSQIGLAKLTMGTGDPAEAATQGHAALDAADPLRSRRIADQLAELHRLAEPHRGRSDVRDLRERLVAASVD
jgi:hypothetical protein